MIVAGSSTVLEVGQELGVKDGVAVLDVVDGEKGVDGGDRDDSEDDRDPDASLFAGKDAGVG